MMSVARELFAVADDLRLKSNAGVQYDASQLSDLSDFLGSIARLARNEEEELAVFRLAEAGQLGRAAVNELATEAMGNLMLDHGKVVRPDFGRKS
ncbi:hypothetical protein AM571_CH03286 [Rhizobium etli 8C-3]|uniref:Uncharacterized protein n=2 Tax=Rhizobium etli TaxID=29449 RepID=A0A1L5P7H7_RHIET|nr:hypothetical protein AM571_CH03286 [Rhizobium etli 8C-3]